MSLFLAEGLMLLPLLASPSQPFQKLCNDTEW